MLASKARYKRVSCPNTIITDVPNHVSGPGVSLLRLPVMVMADHSAHVCYRKGTDVTLRVSTTASVKPHGIQCLRYPIPLDTAARLNAIEKKTRASLPKAACFYPKLPTPRKYRTSLSSPSTRSLNQALPSSTAALMEAKNFAGQVDNSASLGMPFSRTCLMILCCSLAISS